MLCQAPEALRAPLGVDRWQSHALLAQEGTAGDDPQDAAAFDELHSALPAIGFSQEQRGHLYGLLALVIALGDVVFDEADSDASVIREGEALELSAKLMALSAADLQGALCSRTVGGGAVEQYQKPLSPNAARATRASLCRYIYSLAFAGCVEEINKYTVTAATKSGRAAEPHTIG